MTRLRTEAQSSLVRLAQARGIATTYTDAYDEPREVSTESLLGVLQALGEQIERPEDADSCLVRLGRERALADSLDSSLGEPVLVAWDGRLPITAARWLAANWRPAGANLELEDGSDATSYLTGGDRSKTALPFGVHSLALTGRDEPLRIISAPEMPPPLRERSWGLFAPTYALFDQTAGPTGNLSDLERLGRMVGRLGGSYIATLPLLADFSSRDRPSAVSSPYSPLSRLWWNEAYLDLGLLPELEGQLELHGRLTERPMLADVAAAGAFVRDHLALAVRRLLARPSKRREQFEQFRHEREGLLSYATYRAAAETFGPDRVGWPSDWKDGPPPASSADEAFALAVECHTYAQWSMDMQLAQVASRCEQAGAQLLLDLPVGSQPDGYDPWAFPSSFAGCATQDSRPSRGASVGAPPDQFFSTGQNWAFRPLHPEGERQAGYPVTRATLRNLCRHSGAVRLDHVMGLQRLWWIPEGSEAKDGAYVHYRSEEMLAIACLEAFSHDSSLVGEDLGTVDPALKELLAAHGVAGMNVAVFDLEARPGKPLAPKPGGLACIDTHDTATFVGWFDGTDVEDRLELGIVDNEQATKERERRGKARRALLRRLLAAASGREENASTALEVHTALLEELGRSKAGVVLVNIEDLWGEHDPQNIPGTCKEHVNFSRRLAYSLSEIEARAQVKDALVKLHEARHGIPETVSP